MFDNIPKLLKELNIWLCYDARDRANYKGLSDSQINDNKKCPRDLKGRKTSTLKRLFTFNECLESIKKGYNTGVGIVLKNGLVCIDYDNCIDRIETDGNYGFKRVIFKKEVADRITSDINLINSYTEISPSQKGIHIYLIANTKINVKTDAIEIYNNKFIRLTGDTYNDFIFNEVLDRSQELDELINKYGLQNKKGINDKSVLKATDNIYSDMMHKEFKGLTNKYNSKDILNVMFESKKGELIKGLYYDTLNDADIKKLKSKDNIDTSNSGKAITLIMYLLHYSYGDITAVKKLFKQSALCKDDYLKLKYRQNTTDKIDAHFIPYAIINYKNYTDLKGNSKKWYNCIGCKCKRYH